MAKTRLPISTFEFPLAEIRRGYRSAIYFNRTKQILENVAGKDIGYGVDVPHQEGTMQIFQKNSGVLCGMDEVIALLKQCTGHWSDVVRAHQVFDWYMQAKLEARRKPLDVDAAKFVIELEQSLEELWVNTFEDLKVEALFDGDWIQPWEPVARITGNYSSFAHLESVYLGILARATKVASNTNKVVTAAGGKQVLFFADRFDRWTNQGADGYAAYIGGASGFASDAMGSWWGEAGVGTMPHALIAMFDGDIALASRVFHDEFPGVNTVALVDFNNDCVRDSIACADLLGNDLWGVRLDTSENMVDPSVVRSESYGMHRPTGVNPMLVEQVRKGLDSSGYNHVKIIVSGGFNPEKIKQFEDLTVPVDAYAVGSSLLSGSNDFTADIVWPVAKLGRRFRETNRLVTVS